MSDLFGPVCPCCGQQIRESIEPRPFDAFWKIWPDKRGREVARKAWGKLAPAERQIAIQRCELWCKQWRKRNPDASHIMAATFLHQRRFLDDVAAPETVKRAPGLADMAEMIKSGKPWLCRSISPAAVQEMIRRGMVTREQCKAVSL